MGKKLKILKIKVHPFKSNGFMYQDIIERKKNLFFCWSSN